MAKDIWATKPTAERNAQLFMKAYVSKADKAQTCRCEKPVYHRDLDGFRVCCYCGR